VPSVIAASANPQAHEQGKRLRSSPYVPVIFGSPISHWHRLRCLRTGSGLRRCRSARGGFGAVLTDLPADLLAWSASLRRCGRCSPPARASASSLAPGSMPGAFRPSGSASRTPYSPRDRHDRGFHRPDGLCTGHVLAEILQPVFSVRGRPDRASLCKTKKTGSFLAREPGEPIAATVTRRIERHLIERLLRT
jgi:hypothetical protein